MTRRDCFCSEAVPLFGVASKCGIALAANVLHNAGDGAFRVGGEKQASIGELRNLARNCAASDCAYAGHYITTLFSGYSTMP